MSLARTRARGVRDLKAFLTYAEHGPAALTALTSFDPEAACASPVEQAVYETLKALREGTAPKNLKRLASSELTARVMRDSEMRARSSDYLGLKK